MHNCSELVTLVAPETPLPCVVRPHGRAVSLPLFEGLVGVSGQVVLLFTGAVFWFDVVPAHSPVVVTLFFCHSSPGVSVYGEEVDGLGSPDSYAHVLAAPNLASSKKPLNSGLYSSPQDMQHLPTCM